MATPVLARSALAGAVSRGDVKAVDRYFKTASISRLVAGWFMVVICVWVALTCLMAGIDKLVTASRVPPILPHLPSAIITDPVFDDTGYVGEYADETIRDTLLDIASEYNLSVALYNSSEAAHDVYNMFFNDENGVVLYLEEHEDYGVLSYYYGSNVSDLFSPDNMKLLQDYQTHLGGFTHDRAYNVVLDFAGGLRHVIEDPGRTGDTGTILVGVAVFWVLLAIPFYLVTTRLVCASLGVPADRAKRESYHRYLRATALTNQDENKTGGE